MAFWNREKISYEKLNQMVDEAMDGSFSEESYTESELSKLESKWSAFWPIRISIQEEKEKIQELITDISHQTKTPLSGILLYTQLLLEKICPLLPFLWCRKSPDQARRLDFLIHALLKTSRLETGVFQLAPVRQLLFPLLSEARDELASRAALKEIEILLPDSSGEAACFDLKWTKEALCNLLDNRNQIQPEGQPDHSVPSAPLKCSAPSTFRTRARGFPRRSFQSFTAAFPGERQPPGREEWGNRPLSLL